MMKTLLKKVKSLPLWVIMSVLLLQSCLMMHGCSSSSGAPAPPAGSSLYASKCGSCHRLLPPEDYSADVWQVYVDKYGKKMTEEQKQIVLEYHRQQRPAANGK